MKLIVRKSEERGHAEIEWLKSFHTFSFADYYDPKHMGFHSLRVINEDFVAPAKGFGAHPHRNMEIVTFMIEGELEHQDNRGNRAIIKPGEVQKMTAGRGIVHSEMNPSSTQSAHLLQIWIEPSVQGLEPGYTQRSFAEGLKIDGVTKLVSPDGADSSLIINQDAVISLGHFAKSKGTEISIAADRAAWIQLISGELSVSSTTLNAGDALAIEGEGILKILALKESCFLLFDLKQ